MYSCNISFHVQLLSHLWLCFQKLNYRQEMVGTATLSPKDKERMTALLSLHNAMEFMSSEESDEGEGEPATGPPPRHVKPLQWERAKLKNIKAVLDATYQARMTKRQKRTAAKVSRVDGQNVSSRPLPKNCPSSAGRETQS